MAPPGHRSAGALFLTDWEIMRSDGVLSTNALLGVVGLCIRLFFALALVVIALNVVCPSALPIDAACKLLEAVGAGLAPIIGAIVWPPRR